MLTTVYFTSFLHLLLSLETIKWGLFYQCHCMRENICINTAPEESGKDDGAPGSFGDAASSVTPVQSQAAFSNQM